MAEPIPATGYGPASWINWTHNWRQEDGDFLQKRGILRYALDADRPASPQIGQPVYVQATDTTSFWAATAEWVPFLASRSLRLTTAGTGSTGTATLNHPSAAGAGLRFTNLKIFSSLDFETTAGFQADSVSIKTAAGGGNRTAKLTTTPANIVSDSPILAPSMTLNGAAGADALTLSAGNLKVVGSAVFSSTITASGNVSAPGFLTSAAQLIAVNAMTRKDYVDGALASAVDARVAIAGDTMTGALTATAMYISGSQPAAANSLTRRDWVAATFVAVAGDTLTGGLNITGEPPLIVKRASNTPYIDFHTTAAVRLGYIQGTATTMMLHSEEDIILRSFGSDIQFYTSGIFRGLMTDSYFLWGKAASDLNNAGIEMYSTPSGAEGAVRSTVAVASVANFYARHVSSANATGQAFIQFVGMNGATSVMLSQITQDGITGVKMSNVTATPASDYRLKNDLGPITNVVDRFMALQPKSLQWKSNNAYFEGFLAHEVAEIAPYAVFGEKDAWTTLTDPVSGETSEAIDPQQFDAPALMGLTVAMVQILKNAVTDLAGKVTSLEQAA